VLELKNYNSQILNEISLKIDNQNLTILGANGAGKTTLAKVLSGVISSSNITYEEPKTEFINYIPSKLEIFDDYLNVEEFLELSSLHSNKKIAEVLELLDIVHLKNKACKYLSSGESQLLLLASSILHGSKYTILDEPTSNLDPQKVKLVFKILNSNEYLKHKIIITHNLNFAYKLGVDVAYMENGQIKFLGSNEEFFSKNNLYNIFSDSVKKIDDNIVIDL